MNNCRYTANGTYECPSVERFDSDKEVTMNCKQYCNNYSNDKRRLTGDPQNGLNNCSCYPTCRPGKQFLNLPYRNKFNCQDACKLYSEKNGCVAMTGSPLQKAGLCECHVYNN